MNDRVKEDIFSGLSGSVCDGNKEFPLVGGSVNPSLMSECVNTVDETYVPKRTEAYDFLNGIRDIGSIETSVCKKDCCVHEKGEDTSQNDSGVSTKSPDNHEKVLISLNSELDTTQEISCKRLSSSSAITPVLHQRVNVKQPDASNSTAKNNVDFTSDNNGNLFLRLDDDTKIENYAHNYFSDCSDKLLQLEECENVTNSFPIANFPILLQEIKNHPIYLKYKMEYSPIDESNPTFTETSIDDHSMGILSLSTDSCDVSSSNYINNDINDSNKSTESSAKKLSCSVGYFIDFNMVETKEPITLDKKESIDTKNMVSDVNSEPSAKPLFSMFIDFNSTANSNTRSSPTNSSSSAKHKLYAGKVVRARTIKLQPLKQYVECISDTEKSEPILEDKNINILRSDKYDFQQNSPDLKFKFPKIYESELNSPDLKSKLQNHNTKEDVRTEKQTGWEGNQKRSTKLSDLLNVVKNDPQDTTVDNSTSDIVCEEKYPGNEIFFEETSSLGNNMGKRFSEYAGRCNISEFSNESTDNIKEFSSAIVAYNVSDELKVNGNLVFENYCDPDFDNRPNKSNAEYDQTPDSLNNDAVEEIDISEQNSISGLEEKCDDTFESSAVTSVEQLKNVSFNFDKMKDTFLQLKKENNNSSASQCWDNLQEKSTKISDYDNCISDNENLRRLPDMQRITNDLNTCEINREKNSNQNKSYGFFIDFDTPSTKNPGESNNETVVPSKQLFSMFINLNETNGCEDSDSTNTSMKYSPSRYRKKMILEKSGKRSKSRDADIRSGNTDQSSYSECSADITINETPPPSRTFTNVDNSSTDLSASGGREVPYSMSRSLEVRTSHSKKKLLIPSQSISSKQLSSSNSDRYFRSSSVDSNIVPDKITTNKNTMKSDTPEHEAKGILSNRNSLENSTGNNEKYPTSTIYSMEKELKVNCSSRIINAEELQKRNYVMSRAIRNLHTFKLTQVESLLNSVNHVKTNNRGCDEKSEKDFNNSSQSFVKLSDMDRELPDLMVNNEKRLTITNNRMSQSIPEGNNWFESKLLSRTANSKSLSRIFPHLSANIKNQSFSDIEDVVASTVRNMHSSFDPSTFEERIDEDSDNFRTANTLGQDLLRMFLNEISPDVTVEVAGRRIKAHKCILSSRCQYFAAMLSGGWVESAGNVISLHGFTYSVVHFALRYVYSGECDIPDSINIVELAIIADMLCLEGLKEIISHKLKSKYCHFFHKPCNICSVGVLECLPLAAAYGLDDIYRKSLLWITKYYSRLWTSKSFASLPRDIIDKCYRQHTINMTVNNVIEILISCDKLLITMPKVRWIEPSVLITNKLRDFGTKFIAQNFVDFLASEYFNSLSVNKVWAISTVVEKIGIACEKMTVDELCLSYSAIHETFSSSSITLIQNMEHVNLLNQVKEQIERCLIRQARQASKCSAWFEMESVLRHKIQTSAGIIFLSNDIGHRSRFSRGPAESDLGHRSRSLTNNTKLSASRQPKNDLLQTALRNSKLAAFTSPTATTETKVNASQVIFKSKSSNKLTNVKPRYLEKKRIPNQFAVSSSENKNAASLPRTTIRKSIMSSSESSQTLSPRSTQVKSMLKSKGTTNMGRVSNLNIGNTKCASNVLSKTTANTAKLVTNAKISPGTNSSVGKPNFKTSNINSLNQSGQKLRATKVDVNKTPTSLNSTSRLIPNGRNDNPKNVERNGLQKKASSEPKNFTSKKTGPLLKPAVTRNSFSEKKAIIDRNLQNDVQVRQNVRSTFKGKSANLKVNSSKLDNTRSTNSGLNSSVVKHITVLSRSGTFCKEGPTLLKKPSE